jgi:hypothetical protein
MMMVMMIMPKAKVQSGLKLFWDSHDVVDNLFLRIAKTYVTHTY